jgi:hypothetical protein
LPPHSVAPSAFHQPAAIDPGGQALMPLLMVAQKTVQPDEQLAPGPQTDAYAVCGLSTKPPGSTATALPTTPARTRNPRREVRRDNQPVAASAIREVSDVVAGLPSACRASPVMVTRRSRPGARSAAAPP